MFYLLFTKISFFKVWLEVQTLSKNLDKKKKGNGKGILERGAGVAYYTYNFNFTNEISFALFHFYNLPRKLGGGSILIHILYVNLRIMFAAKIWRREGAGVPRPPNPSPIIRAW